MSNVWELLSRFEFIGRLVNADLGGVSLYYVYIALLFAGFWPGLIYLLVKNRRELLPKLFPGPCLLLALGLAAFFFLFGGNNNIYSAPSYEVQNLADAAAAVGAGELAPVVRQTRIVPLIFGAVLYFSNLQVLKVLLWGLLGLFYSVWALILSDVFGFSNKLVVPLLCLAAVAHVKTFYFFSAYAIFALCFSALFLYSLLAIVKKPPEEVSFLRLSQPVYLILLASLFRQESVVLFLVYFTGMAFAGKALFKKALLSLLAGAVLYLPFLYRDWTHEENQVLSYSWNQELVEQVYSAPPGAQDFSGVAAADGLLLNAATNIKNGSRGGMGRQEFVDAVRLAYFAPQPSLRNVWYNLKYRSGLFLLLTAAWLAVLLAGLLNLRYLRGELKYLAVLAAYICSLFLIYHLANMAVMIGLSYNYLVPAYLAFCLIVARSVYRGRAGAV